MNLSCTSKTIKYLMFIFNFVFVITGIIILGVGVSAKTHYYKYDVFLDGKYFSLPNMLIATGSLIFFISFLGCYGAMRENWQMLMAFSVLLGIIFIFELSVGIAGYVLRDKTSNYLVDKLNETLGEYNSSRQISDIWDTIQDEFHCCGVFGPQDWNNVFNSSDLPVSCCPQTGGTIGAFYCNSHLIPTVTTPTTATSSTTEKPAPPPSDNENDNDDPHGSDTDNGDNPVDGNGTADGSNTAGGNENGTANKDGTNKGADATKTKDNSVATNNNPIAQSVNLLADDDNSTTTAYPPSSSIPYSTGCETAFGDFVKSHAVDIGAVGIALAVLQLVGILFSFHLARQLKNGYYST